MTQTHLVPITQSQFGDDYAAAAASVTVLLGIATGAATAKPVSHPTKPGPSAQCSAQAVSQWAHSHRTLAKTTPQQFGKDVADLQTDLNRHGAHLPVNGFYGPKTTAAVKDLQKHAKLQVTGIVGEHTWTWIYRDQHNCK